MQAIGHLNLNQSRPHQRFRKKPLGPDYSLSVKFQEVVHAKESWDTWVNEDPKHPTTSNA
jgi:hypothetical protein